MELEELEENTGTETHTYPMLMQSHEWLDIMAGGNDHRMGWAYSLDQKILSFVDQLKEF